MKTDRFDADTFKHAGQKIAVETRTVKLFRSISDKDLFVVEFFDLLKAYELINKDIKIED